MSVKPVLSSLAKNCFLQVAHDMLNLAFCMCLMYVFCALYIVMIVAWKSVKEIIEEIL